MIKKFKPLITLLGVLLSNTAMLSNTAIADEATIKLGSILILSSEGSAWGNASKNGIDMAVEELNSQGGIDGKNLVVYHQDHQDDQGDPKKSISAFKHLTEVEGVNFIIGPTWSNLGMPLVKLALDKKVIMISPSLGVAGFNEDNEFIFNTWPHDYILSQKLAEYVYQEGHRNVALVGAEHIWVKEQTNAFKKRFEDLGGKILFLTEPLPGSRDLESEALKIKKIKNIDAFVSTTDGVIVGSLIAKSLKILNLDLAKYSITLDQSAIDAAQGGFEKLKFLTFLTPSSKFQKDYEAKFKIPIDIGADSAYDAVMMLAQAMQKSKSLDTTILSKELSNITTYRGASGSLISDGKRAFTKDYLIKEVIAGIAVNSNTK